MQDTTHAPEHFIMLDVGDLMARYSERDSIKTLYSVRIMSKLGYTLMAIGERDLSLPPEWWKNMEKETGIEFLCANIIDEKTNSPVFKPYVIKKFEGLKVGVLALLSEKMQLSPYGMDENKKSWENLKIQNPVETAKKYVPILRKKAHLVVVLAHLGYDDERKLGSEVSGIDILIGGHDGRTITEPEIIKVLAKDGSVIDSVFFVKPGIQAKEMGKIVVNLDENGKILAKEGTLTALGDAYSSDPEVDSILKIMNDEIRQLQDKQAHKELEKRFASDVFSGSLSCKECHSEIYDHWTTTAHFTATDKLSGSELKDAMCLKCHTTGYGYNGGFVSLSETENLKGVGCESCHLPRKSHIERIKANQQNIRQGSIIPATCTMCHNNKCPKAEKTDFNYIIYRNKIMHPVQYFTPPQQPPGQPGFAPPAQIQPGGPQIMRSNRGQGG